MISEPTHSVLMPLTPHARYDRGNFVKCRAVALGIIDIKADVDYILFHRRLRFCLMVGASQLTNLRYPSLMVALGSAKVGGVY